MQRPQMDQLEPRRLLATALGVGGSGLDYGTASALMDDGGMVVAGLFSGSVSFDVAGGARTTLNSAGASDIFVARYDADQQLLWARQFGGTGGRLRISGRESTAIDVAINPARAGGESFVNGVNPQPANAGEYVNAVAVGPNGEIYFTGGFVGEADFDPGAGSHILRSVDRRFYDAFVARLSPGGELVWANSFGGQFTDMGNDITVDSEGNPHVVGRFTRTADFNPTSAVYNLEARGRSDTFVMKLSVNGRLIWVSAVGGDETARAQLDSGNGIAVDRLGNVYVTGSFAGVADFNPTPGRGSEFLVRAVDETDGYVMQLSTRGKLVWVRTFGGAGYDGGQSIALVGNPDRPEIVVAGYFEFDVNLNVDGRPTTLRATPQQAGRNPVATDLLVSRYSNEGDLRWAGQIGGPGYETVGHIATDAAENIYMTGGFYGQVDFNPGTGESILASTAAPFRYRDSNDRRGRTDSYDAYFASLDGSGGFRFARGFGSDQDDFGIGLSRPRFGDTADLGAFVVTGRFASIADLDPDGSVIRTARGRSDIFVSLFSDEGSLL
jgi:hypothetical protein